MKPELVQLDDKTYSMKIPVKDVEQAKQAMKVHVRMLGFLGGDNTTTIFVQGSGTEGQVNATYETIAVSNQDTYFHTTTIVELSDDRTVYDINRQPGLGGNYRLTLEVGKEKNEMGKDLLVIHSSQKIQLYGRWATPILCCVLLPLGLCFLAPCLKALILSLMKMKNIQTSKNIQNYVNSYVVTNNAVKEIPMAERVKSSDIDAVGI